MNMEEEKVIKISPRVIYYFYMGDYKKIYERYSRPVTISEYKKIYEYIYNTVGNKEYVHIKKMVGNVSLACDIYELLNLHPRTFAKRIPKEEWVQLKKWVETYI